MTSTSQDTAVGGGPSDDVEAAPRRRRVPRLEALTLLAGLVAVVCAVLLPLLPVSVDRPVLAWPQAGGPPVSTAMALTTQRPLEIDVRFGCAEMRAAAATPGGVVVATGRPGYPGAERAGLVATARGGRLAVSSRGTPLFTGPIPAGDCSAVVHGDLDGVVMQLDGATVGRLPGPSLPDVDALVSDIAGPAPGLSVRITPDDQSSTSPTPLKIVVLVLLVVAVLGALAGLGAIDRRHAGARERTRWAGRPAVVDVVVPLVMLAWLFIAPTTDDDGYYAAMAANVPHSGYVANYYQLFNQSFTPYTWIYYALSWWQQTVGTSPVLTRVPALVLGLLTWLLVRRYVRRFAGPEQVGARLSRVLVAVLGLAFLAWWLPYDMGVRPEAVVAASVMASLLGLATAVEQRRALPAALAVLAAGVGFTAGTTGFAALAPLLAGAPALWRMLRARGVLDAVVALVGIVSAGAVVAFLAFADGSLRDFARAQQIFLGMQYPESWSTEIVRWDYLLDDTAPMGNYAKRTPVLLTLFVLVGFLLIAARWRSDEGGWSARLRLAGTTTVLAFLLLWMTPSKWTHHFGALAGVGAVVLAGTLVLGPGVVRTLSTGPVRWPLPVGALVGLAVVVALADNGANSWAYSWMLGVPHPTIPPQVSFLRFGSPVWWLLGGAVVTGVIVVLARRRGVALRGAAPLIALPVVAVVALLVTTGYMVGGFALAAARTGGTYSLGADDLRDPLAHSCGASQEVEALDPRTAVALPPVAGSAASTTGDAFTPSGWSPSSPPPVAGVPVWGSHRPGPDGADPADGAGSGTITTPWFALPAAAPGTTTSVYLAGRTGNGNDVRLEYAALDPTGPPRPIAATDGVGEGKDDDAVDAREWRSVALEGRFAPPAGARAVRLVVSDASDGVGGWTALTAPTVQRWTRVDDVVPAGSATAVGWPIALLFPCLRAPVQAGGVDEPVSTVVTWGDAPLSGVADSAFLPQRGGLFVGSYRNSAVTQLSARLRDFPATTGIEVYTLRDQLPGGRYTVEPGRQVVPGWAPAPNTTFSTPVGPEAVVRP